MPAPRCAGRLQRCPSTSSWQKPLDLKLTSTSIVTRNNLPSQSTEPLMTSLQDLSRIVLIGIGATAVMDLWLLALRRFGVPTLSFAFIGRWAGHLARGRFFHAAIGRAAPVRGELALGWLVHYGVGVAFA